MSELCKKLASSVLLEDVDTIQKLTVNPLQLNNDEDVYILFMLAIEKSIAEILNIFYDKLPLKKFINCLCEHDDLERMKYSMDHNLNKFKYAIINNFDYSLNVCVKFNSFRVLKWLIKFRDDSKDIKIKIDADLLHTACKYSRTNIVQFLCDRNVIHINSKNLLGENSLHIACKSDCNEIIVKILINTGINVNWMDCYGNTAFSNACFYENHQLIKLLLEVRFKIRLNIDHTDCRIQNYKMKFQNLNSILM